MTLRFPRLAGITLAVAALGSAVAVTQTQTPAGQPPQERERRSNRDERLEKVGPTAFRVIPTNTPYDRWYEKAKTKIPTFGGLAIQDVRTTPLKPWADMGVSGVYMRMADYQIIDGWVLEIPAKGSTKAQRHMFEHEERSRAEAAGMRGGGFVQVGDEIGDLAHRESGKCHLSRSAAPCLPNKARAALAGGFCPMGCAAVRR